MEHSACLHSTLGGVSVGWIERAVLAPVVGAVLHIITTNLVHSDILIKNQKHMVLTLHQNSGLAASKPLGVLTPMKVPRISVRAASFGPAGSLWNCAVVLMSGRVHRLEKHVSAADRPKHAGGGGGTPYPG